MLRLINVLRLIYLVCVKSNIFTCMIVVNIFRSTSCELFSNANPSTCQENEFFNVIHLKCVPCPAMKNLKPASDRLSCICDDQSRLVLSNDMEFPTCSQCPVNTFPSEDQSICLPCYNMTVFVDKTSCKICGNGMIFVERKLNGIFNNHSYCEKCEGNTVPDSFLRHCVPCGPNKVKTSSHNCTCASKMRATDNGDCIPNDMLLEWPDDRNSFVVEYDNGIKVFSQFFQRNLLSSVKGCKMKNSTACQALANMCTMVLFYEKYTGSPCKIFLDSNFIQTKGTGVIPWLFYSEGEALTVLNRRRIITKYTSKGNGLRLIAWRTAADGQSLGFADGVSALLLCPDPWAETEGARVGLRLAVPRHIGCRLPARRLLQRNASAEFLDLFVRVDDDGAGTSSLLAVPVLVRNMRSGRIPHNNQGEEPSRWLLVRRLFPVDSLSGIPASVSDPSPHPVVIRYMQSCELRVRFVGPEDQGRIYSPLLVVRYGEVSKEQMEANALLPVTFSVVYDMPSNLPHAIEVAVGVFSSLAVVWSGIETWSFSRRSGRLGIDLFTLGELILFTCGNLANAFFLVMASISLHTFCFYKGQTVVHVLLPPSKHEDIVKTYIIVSFTLKIIQVFWMIWRQLAIDIFFIDWERPRAMQRAETTTPGGGLGASALASIEPPVSVWRSYFVANEWNELQAKRKISIFVQLIVTMFFLKVVGLENWGVADPNLSLHAPDAQPSFICRLAVGVIVWLFVYFMQRLFLALIYERYIKNEIQQFVDVCSMANISVFILSLNKFGYYIHGRSAHGFADTDMHSIARQLQREEEDLCGHRGLQPGGDHQTFQMAVPSQLRTYYNKVLAPVSYASAKRPSAGALRSRPVSTAAASASAGGGASGAAGAAAFAHRAVNSFLAAFLEHALVDLDYEVKDMMFSEALLDMEFSENPGKGTFYKDNGHSFDKILFYGNEFILASFDLILFCFVETLAQDYLLAALVTAVCAQVLIYIREVAGRRNLAQKTLIDERFLI